MLKTNPIVTLALRALAALVFSAAPIAFAQEAEGDAKEESPKLQAGLHAGLGGAGVHFDYPVSEKIRIRGVGNYLQWDFDEEAGGVQYKGDLNLQSYGVALDWHPTGGGFRAGIGAFLNNNEVDANAEDNMLDIGGTEYNARVNANLSFEKFAPYAGIGYGGDLAPGFNFYLDLGVLYTGEPELTMDGNLRGGASCNFSVDKDSNATATGDCMNLQSDLAAEHRDAKDDLAKVKFYPVAAFGVSYRF